MTTVVVAIDDHDIARACDAIAGDAAPAAGETARLVRLPDGRVVSVVYAGVIVDMAARRIEFALRTLLDRMRDLDDAERRIVIAIASEAIDRSVAVIEQSIAAVEAYLKENINGDNCYPDA